MSKRETKPKVASEAIHVETATTIQGRAATTISVEVDETKLGRKGDESHRAERAVAMVPRTHEGQQEWTEEELHHSGRRVTDDDRVLKTFNATVSGPVDVRESGVAVRVETSAGTLWASEEDEPLATRDADKESPTKLKA
jgi:hypothetical protein